MTAMESIVSNIRSTCKKVLQESKYVSINAQKIESFAQNLLEKGLVKPGQSLEGVEWDACGWHYSDDSLEYGPVTCQYIFVLDSLNFCFWEVPGLEYETLAVALRDVLRRDVTAFSAVKLANITEDDLRGWFPTDRQLPNMIERVRVLRELGQVLLDEFNGLACNLVSKASHSAVKLVELVARYLPGFRDCTIYKGYRVDLYKRAQILVGDIWAAYRRQVDNSTIYAFSDIAELTMFADYRVPQILRHYEVMEYNTSLASRIDNLIEIPSGSEEETEIRALTIVAVDMLHACLKMRGVDLLVIEVDWLLWQQGEATKDSIAPGHRTRTIYY